MRLWDEIKATCMAMPGKAQFFSLLAAWLLLFHLLGNSTFGYVDTRSLLEWMWNAYNSSIHSDDHGMLIPFAVLALFWWKRALLLAVSKRPWAPGLAILAGAVTLHIVGYLVQQPRVSVIALFTGIYGLMGLTWGPAWLRASFFPFFLFIFCVPVGSLADTLTFPLRILVTKVSVGIGQGLGIDVIRDGSRIFNESRTFQYDVAPACSGIRSLVALIALSTIHGFMSFQSAWRRAVMVLAALPLAVAGNVARVSSVIIAAQLFGQEAGAKWHDYAGFVTFLVAIGLIFTLAKLLEEKDSMPSGTACPQQGGQAGENTNNTGNS